MPPKRKDKAGDTDTGVEAKKSKSDASASKKKGKESIPEIDAASFASTATNKEGKSWNLKIASWNVNGIRAWIQKNGQTYIEAEKPDMFCVQETKCNESQIPEEAEVEGYHTHWSSGDKEGYSGVGLYSKTKPISVTYGIPDIEKHNKEGRVITAEFEKFFLVTSYVPNSGRGLPRLDYRTKEWDVDFREYLLKLDKKKPVIMCGDLNVAHLEIDLANPKNNKKTAGFTQQERDGFTDLLSAGFVDSFRHLYPDKTKEYSFWTYMGNARSKNVGWRLDYFVVSDRIKDNICDSVIRQSVMGSDHAPVALLLNI